MVDTTHVFLLLIFCIYFNMAITKNEQRGKQILKQIESVVGDKAILPCRVQDGKTNITEWPVLIIWYKNQDSPIYSVDHRERAIAKHWSNNSIAERIYFSKSQGFAMLTINNVQVTDGGEYRCREDFKYAPTRNNFILLNIIIPPSRLEIVASNNRVIWNSTVPPVIENESLEITCIAYDGRPLPRVMWNIRGENEDTAYGMRISDTAVANTLRIAKVRRENLGKTLVCEASNVANAVQLSTSVTINVYLKPLSISLTGAEQAFTSGEPNSLECVSYGSRPAANITWYYNGREIDYETRRIKVIENFNMTWSTLKIIPNDDNDLSVITCEASNSYFPAYSLQKQVTLHVHYPPRLQINLGRNLNASDIKEGSDVYFECIVKASPAITRLEWDHNGTEVGPHSSRKIIYSNQTLVLQSITRHGSGSYRCMAINANGKSVSDIYMLDVKFEPTCNTDQQRVYGAHKGETVWIKCDVNSNPSALSFRWVFNSSISGLTNVITLEKSSPIIKFKVNNFGMMLCWATNSLGIQSQPCIFHVVPAERPGSPRNCTPINITSTRFTVFCELGYGGGLPQHLTSNVAMAARPDLMIANYNGQAGLSYIEATGLRPSTQYVATVYAINAKGTSIRHMRVYVETAPNPKDPRVAGDSTSTATRFSDAAYIGIFLLGCCMVGACAMAVVFAKRLASNVRRSPSVFQQRPTTVMAREDQGIRFAGTKGSADRCPVVSKSENGYQSRTAIQLKSHDFRKNMSCRDDSIEQTTCSVMSIQEKRNVNLFNTDNCVTNKNIIRSYGMRMSNGDNQQKLCESFVVYPNHKSVPVQDMVYTRAAKPYTEIESIV
ncbi:hemicentin-1-like isoform X1 [Daktulosphaira vitifoliae]|uniref:hemicentin-1-like isoform X1 n=1 Tax=Daktulosphaira vitifoliae TaxID=58002 RepID=UPI0021AA934F|nr:hemicentin-1-like isoform X1 [Daktulosphaira vitifoliae]XP_050531048.1 hemicentin-1-like isoform X2 [Daktulosphaira vitifoliae]XP_050531049.1 hemicentin-1-like isoform X1 [Daktulosphaira vitifoliae]